MGYHMAECGSHYAKWEKTATDGQTLFDSTYISYVPKSNSETKSTMWLPGVVGKWECGINALWI